MKEEIQEIEIDPNDEKTLPENILRGLILSYQNAYNAHSTKNEVKYYLTKTFHKLPTQDGNKDVVYLRLERAVKDKNYIKDPNLPEEQQAPEWTAKLIHTEMYTFKSITEQVNPDAQWRTQIYWNMIGRLLQAGLEYAELLQRLKQTKMDEALPEEPKKLDLEITNEMPRPLNQSEAEYAEWVKANNIYAKDKQ